MTTIVSTPDSQYARNYTNMMGKAPLSDDIDNLFMEDLHVHNDLWKQYLQPFTSFLESLMNSDIDIELNFNHYVYTRDFFLTSKGAWRSQQTTIILKDINNRKIPKFLRYANGFKQETIGYYNHQFFPGTKITWHACMYETDIINKVFTDWCAYHAGNIKFAWVYIQDKKVTAKHEPAHPIPNPDKLSTLWLS